MLSEHEIEKIVNVCQVQGKRGLRNGVQAVIPEIHIDIVKQHIASFFGVKKPKECANLFV